MRGKRFCLTKTQLVKTLFVAAAIANMVPKMNANKTPGRPPKAAAQSRRHQIAFRVTDAELNAIETAAAANHLSVGAFARSCAVAEKDPARPSTPAKRQAAVDASAVAELNRIGVTMGQLLMELRHGSMSETDLRLAIGEVRDAIAALAGPD